MKVFRTFCFLYARTLSFLKANSSLMAYDTFTIMAYYITLFRIVGYVSFILYKLDSNVIKLVRIINPLSANPTKWSNTLKEFVGNLPTNSLSVFGHFVGLALEGLSS